MKPGHAAVWVGCTVAALMATTGCGADTAKKTAEVLSGTDRIMAVLSTGAARPSSAP